MLRVICDPRIRYSRMMIRYVMWCKTGSNSRSNLEFQMNTFFGHLQLAALGDLDGDLGLVAGVLVGVLDLVDNFVALQDLAEDDVLAVQPAMRSVISLFAAKNQERSLQSSGAV